MFCQNYRSHVGENYAEKRGVSSRVKTTASIMDWVSGGGSAGGKLPGADAPCWRQERYGRVGTRDFLQQEYGLTRRSDWQTANPALIMECAGWRWCSSGIWTQ